MSSTVPYRPLGLIKELLEANSFSVTHCYDDLIFIEHNAFLLQMGEKGEEVSLVFNVDCEMDSRQSIEQTLAAAGKQVGLDITPSGTYKVTPNPDDDTLNLEFFKE